MSYNLDIIKSHKDDDEYKIVSPILGSIFSLMTLIIIIILFRIRILNKKGRCFARLTLQARFYLILFLFCALRSTFWFVTDFKHIEDMMFDLLLVIPSVLFIIAFTMLILFWAKIYFSINYLVHRKRSYYLLKKFIWLYDLLALLPQPFLFKFYYGKKFLMIESIFLGSSFFFTACGVAIAGFSLNKAIKNVNAFHLKQKAFRIKITLICTVVSLLIRTVLSFIWYFYVDTMSHKYFWYFIIGYEVVCEVFPCIVAMVFITNSKSNFGSELTNDKRYGYQTVN
eukprot:TRINITY_DN4580_c0_g1_i1.p1 TRINITY_DN4580_c0_g1~~TRINITY_DN4580_c0_g1_i1.p1  ORF type:complete len:283 (+),score=-4.47 TRINITY_DN4580_c0_g1_i1:78-926(+)